MTSTKLLPDSHITTLMFRFPPQQISALVSMFPTGNLTSRRFRCITEAMQEYVETVVVLMDD